MKSKDAGILTNDSSDDETSGDFEGKNDETWKKSVKHILNTSSKKSVKINDVSSLDESFVGITASFDFKLW